MYFEYLEQSEYGDSWLSCIVPDYVSSTLKSQGNNSYNKSNLGDRDPRTAWVEGADGYGIGEYIEMRVYAEALKDLRILNGDQKSIKSWKDNSRVKSFKVYINNVPVRILELEDRMGEQIISFDDLLPEGFDIWSAEDFEIKLEILAVYPGERWKDVCISGISFFGCYC